MPIFYLALAWSLNMDMQPDIFDRLLKNDRKIKALKDLSKGVPPKSPAPAPLPEAPFRDVPDPMFKGMTQSLVYGKGPVPIPNGSAPPPPPQAAPPPQAKAPSSAMQKQGVGPNMSTEGPWGAPPNMPRW